MSTSITALEDERRELLRQIMQLGDFRPGSISTIQGRCGKPACRCHQPGQPPHGPHFRLTRKVRGKTVSETFSSPAARRKAQREVDQFHRFQQLCGALLAINEKICRGRPVEEEDSSPTQQEKKTAAAVRQEVSQEVDKLLGVLFAARRKHQGWDLEAVEMATRAAVHQAGAALLEQLLATQPPAEAERPCPCGQLARYREMRPKKMITVVGEVEVQRAYYLCKSCHQGQFPLDTEFDIEATQYSPGVRRMMALVGSETSFQQGREQLEVLAGLEVTAKAVERQAEVLGADIAGREQVEIQRAKQLELPQVCTPTVPLLYLEMDGTGVPVVTSETAGRVGKTAGQSARTREVKLGCVFTQTTTDEQGRPLRDENSTTYTAAIEGPMSLVCVFTPRPGGGAGAGLRRKSSLAMARSGSGISPTNISRARFRSWISTTLDSTFGNCPRNYSRARSGSGSAAPRGC